jgi:hypothetical protein
VIVFTCSIRVLAYVRLARREEREVESKFEEAIEDRFSLTRGKIAAYATGMGAQGKEKRWRRWQIPDEASSTSSSGADSEP